MFNTITLRWLVEYAGHTGSDDAAGEPVRANVLHAVLSVVASAGPSVGVPMRPAWL